MRWKRNKNLMLTMLVLQAFRKGEHELQEKNAGGGLHTIHTDRMEIFYARYNTGTLVRDDGHWTLVGWRRVEKK